MNFNNKKILIFGVANKNSIAYSILNELYENGAEIIIAYQERAEKLVKDACKKFKNLDYFPCDVTRDETIIDLFKYIKKKYGKIDNIVHSIAFTKKEDLMNRFIETPKDHYQLAHEVSAYSLIQIARNGEKSLKKGGSIITLTFQGSNFVFENYNVMGICKANLEATVRYLAKDLGEKGVRINAVSAGPIKTLAASAISGFENMLNFWEKQSLLKRNVTAKEVAKAAAFLLSDYSSGITGEVLTVDAGFSKVGYLDGK